MLLRCGKVVNIHKIEYNILAQAVNVYSFEVEDLHTYFVGRSLILVHNACENPADVAKELGYNKVKGRKLHGQAIFQNSKAKRSMRYISRDIDNHNGGYWKAAKSINDLGSRATRTGTFDKYLRRHIGK